MIKPMIDLGKKNLLGIHVHAVDYDAAIAKVIESARSRSRCTVTALAVHGVMTGVLDKTHRHRLNRFDLVVPDGQPVRWGLNLLHKTRLNDRVYGPNLMLKVCQSAAENSLPVYLFGGTPEMLDQLRCRLIELFPGLQIAGQSPSKFRRLTPDENRELVDEIRQSGARICFAGIGCPRQEVWAFEMGDLLEMPILAVGAAFAFHAGQVSQAPHWMQDRGLEWFYRLMSEPRRLWKRYLFLNPAYLCLLAMQKVGLRRFDPDNSVPPESSMLYG